MGDRVWIQIESESQAAPISLYGHWAGEQALEAVRNVIAKTDRIGDPVYLTAQVFHEFTTLGGYSGGLGYGITAGFAPEEDDRPTVYLDADTGIITVNGEQENVLL